MAVVQLNLNIVWKIFGCDSLVFPKQIIKIWF